MEFIRNNINAIDIKDKVQEETAVDKIHSAEEINVKNDLNDNKKTDFNKQIDQRSKEKKTITIDGVKSYDDELSIKIERIENMGADNSKGRFLDAKK